MDPVALVTKTLALTDAVVGGLKLFQIVLEAPAEIASLINDMSDLQVVFKEVHSALQQYHDATNHSLLGLNLLLGRAKEKLLQLDQIIQYCTPSGPEGKVQALQKTAARFRWVRGKPRVGKLQKDLLEIKLGLAAMWGAANSIDLSRIHMKLENISFVTETLEATQRLELQNAAHLEEQRRLLIDLAGYFSKLGFLDQSKYSSAEVQYPPPDYSEGKISEMPKHSELTDPIQQGLLEEGLHTRGSTSTSFDFVGIGTAWSQIPKWTGQATSGSMTGIRIGVRQMRGDSCRRFCNCVCHKKSHVRTPKMLNNFLGNLFVGYTGLPLISPRCNESLCYRRSKSSMRINYYFPSWFLMRVVSIMAAYSNQGPEMLLRVKRLCPANAEIFSFACLGNVEGIKYLFENGLASPYDVEYGTGISALHKAVDWRQMEVVQLLLTEGSDPFLQDQNGWTPTDTVLQLAFTKGNEHGTAFNQFLRALDSNIFETLQLSTLHKIVLGLVNLDIEKQLNASTSEINLQDSGGQTPLFWAANRGDVSTVRTLLEYGAKPDLRNMLGKTALHWAIESPTSECTKLLLEYGAPPNARSVFGTTALFYAVWTHDDPANHIEDLLEYNADVNVKNDKGLTPLHYAAFKDVIAPVAILIDRGASLEECDNNGITPLMLAIQNNLTAVTSYLLGQGSNRLVVNNNNETIRHVAAAKGSPEMFSALERFDLHEIDIEMRNSARLTPRDIISQRVDGSPKLVEAFEQLLPNVQSSQTSETDSQDGRPFFDALEYHDTPSEVIPL